MSITLDQLLASRDDRHRMQTELLAQHPGAALVCLTVIMPGSVKRNAASLIVAEAALEALKETFMTSALMPSPIVRDLETGYEAYLPTSLKPTEAKRLACEVEETHPLGRLFDLDIIGYDGIPLSRETIGCQPRRCLLCDNEARYCMRNHSHTQDEILARIQELIES